MANETQTGSGAGQPYTVAELIAALQRFTTLSPLERARQSPALIEASKTVLAGERSAAMVEATNPAAPGYVSQRELARQLGVSKQMVGKTVARVAVAFAVCDEAGEWYGHPDLAVTPYWDCPLAYLFEPPNDVYNPLYGQRLILRCADLPDDRTVTPYAARVMAEHDREIAVRVTERVRDAMFGPPIIGTPERTAWEQRRDQRKRRIDQERRPQPESQNNH